MGTSSLPGSRCSRPRACAAGSPKRKTIPANELYAVALNVPAGDGVFTYRIAAELGAAEAGRRVVVWRAVVPRVRPRARGRARGNRPGWEPNGGITHNERREKMGLNDVLC